VYCLTIQLGMLSHVRTGVRLGRQLRDHSAPMFGTPA